MRVSRFLFAVVPLLILFESVRLWNLSPSMMAAHFNIQGEPDRFVSRSEFFFYEAQTLLIVIGLAVLAQFLLVFLPIELINIPNREIWLSPEQRQDTISRLSTFLDAIFGSILVVVHIGFELAVSANLHDPIVFSAQLMTLLIAGFLIFSLGILVWLVGTFRYPPASG